MFSRTSWHRESNFEVPAYHEQGVSSQSLILTNPSPSVILTTLTGTGAFSRIDMWFKSVTVLGHVQPHIATNLWKVTGDMQSFEEIAMIPVKPAGK